MAILLVLLFFMFQAVFSWAQPVMDLITAGFAWLGTMIGHVLPDGLLKSFLCDGLIAGVGSVVVFLPQIMILFLFIILLEDVGYMARAAFLMDRIMGGAGLHGRAFIPLLSSHACAIPGIMATRVIDQKRDRLTTILVAPLTTCSARIPIYTLIISAFVPNHTLFGWVSEQGLVMLGLYASGIISALAVAFVHPHGVLARRFRAVPDGAAGLQAARPVERGPAGPAAGRNLLAPRRDDHPLDDGDRLGAVEGPVGASEPRTLRSTTASPASSVTPFSRSWRPSASPGR